MICVMRIRISANVIYFKTWEIAEGNLESEFRLHSILKCKTLYVV